MRTRRWILVTALVVTVMGLVLYYSWTLLSINEKIKNYVLIKIKPALGGECNIEKLSFALGAVHLKNIVINFKNDCLSLHVPDVRVGINVIGLIKNGFQPQKLTQDILFFQPQLTIRTGHKIQSQQISLNSSAEELSAEEYWQKIREYDFIKHINISKGKITYIDSSNDEFQLAHDIHGRLSSSSDSYISAQLAGKLFYSNNCNLFMYGVIDIIQERLDLLNVKLSGYRWEEKIPILIPDSFDIKRGTINGILSLAEKKSGRLGFDIWGEVIINNGAVQIPANHLYFDDINVKARIENWNCVIEASDLLLNGSKVIVSGAITNLLNPRLNLILKSDYFDLQKNWFYLAPKSKLKIKGYSMVSLQLTHTFDNPGIAGQIRSLQIRLNHEVFRNINATVSLQDSVFKLINFVSQWQEMRLTGSGAIDFSRHEDNIFFSLSGNGTIFSGLIRSPFPSLDSSTTLIQMQGKGNFAELTGTVDVRIRSFSLPDSTFHLACNFEVLDQKLLIQLKSVPHFSGEGLIYLTDRQPGYQIKLINSHVLLYRFPELKLIQRLFNFKTSFLQIQGEPSNWKVTGSCVWVGHEENQRTANLAGTIKSKDDSQEIIADLALACGDEKFQGNINFVVNPKYLEIKNFAIENLFYGNGRVPLKDPKIVAANIVLPDASLNRLASLIFDQKNSINQGKLKGFVTISGTLNDINLTGKLDFMRVILNHVGVYDAAMSFHIIHNELKFEPFEVRHNRHPMLQCDGTYSLNKDWLNFKIKGPEVDLNTAIASLLNRPGLLTGAGKIDLKLSGKAKRPQLSGIVEAQNGNLGPFSFSRIVLDLGPAELSESTHVVMRSDTLESGGLIFQQILITRVEQFNVQGRGVIPFSNEQSMDIELEGSGNFLSLLPEVTSFFKETQSHSQWDIHLTGRPDDVIISDGKLKVTDGYLRLGDVAPEIKSIAADMELEQDGFLNVKFISGKIKGKPVAFQNFRASPGFKPFLIPGIELDLGVFTLVTSAHGVPLHIPALMEKGEMGQFVLGGENADRKFVVAGPIEQPVISGKILIKNANFTFPFIISNTVETAPHPVVEVLKSIDWNVTALAGNSLHYQRQIPSGVDNVYVDLIIDAGGGGLLFNGVINDHTFGVVGSLESSRGTVEYLDLDFQVMKAGVEFDREVTKAPDVEFDKSTLLPIIYGEARTTVTDSTGYPYYIYLTLLTIDKKTGHRLRKGRFGEMVFQLTTDNPNLGDTEGEILASLGYSTAHIPKVATDIIGISTDNLIFRPLFRPFERQLEQSLGLDLIRFSSRFTRNLIEMNLKDERNFSLNSKLFLLRSTKLMIGKYLTNRLFLLYTGQLEAGMDYRYQQEGFGFRHTWGLEYRFNPGLLLQMEYDYNSLLLWQKEDKKILLRHSFPF